MEMLLQNYIIILFTNIIKGVKIIEGQNHMIIQRENGLTNN